MFRRTIRRLIDLMILSRSDSRAERDVAHGSTRSFRICRRRRMELSVCLSVASWKERVERKGLNGAVMRRPRRPSCHVTDTSLGLPGGRET